MPIIIRRSIIRKKSSIKQLERATLVVAEEEVVVHEEPFTNQFEKELKRIMKESNYSNVSMIYRKFYKESRTPSAINTLFMR